MIFQDPISSLNPRRRVRDIVAEPLIIWRRGTKEERARQGAGDARRGGDRPRRRPATGGPGVLRRAVPAHQHRPRPDARPRPPHLRRAGLGPRRVGPGPDPQPAGRPQGPVRAHHGLHRPRPRRGEERERPGGGHVPREAGARWPAPTSSTAAAAHPYTEALLGSIPEPDPGPPLRPPGAHRGAPLAPRPALGLPLPDPLPLRPGPLRRAGAPAARDRPGPPGGLPLPAGRSGTPHGVATGTAQATANVPPAPQPVPSQIDA